MSEWLALACSPPVVRRAALSSVIVGLVLNSINHGDAVWAGDISVRRLFQMGLTMLVPYCVSTVSSVGALRSIQRQRPDSQAG